MSKRQRTLVVLVIILILGVISLFTRSDFYVVRTVLFLLIILGGSLAISKILRIFGVYLTESGFLGVSLLFWGLVVGSLSTVFIFGVLSLDDRLFPRPYPPDILLPTNNSIILTLVVPTSTVTPVSTTSPPPTPSLSTTSSIPTPPPLQTFIETAYRRRVARNQSFPVRVSLVYSQAGTSPTPRISQGEDAVEMTRPAPLGTPGPLSAARGDDYDAFVVARLTGSGVDIQPEVQKEYRLLDQDDITWPWSVTALRDGELILNTTVDIEWRPRNGGEPITYQLETRRLFVDAYTPLFAFGDPLSLTAILSAAGGALALWAIPKLWARFTTRHQQKSSTRRNRK